MPNALQLCRRGAALAGTLPKICKDSLGNGAKRTFHQQGSTEAGASKTNARPYKFGTFSGSGARMQINPDFAAPVIEVG